MPSPNNELFYSRLPVNEIPLADLLTEEHLFYKVPDNWWVVITDVKNSTLAIQQGLHEAVNLVATGSIVAVLNIAYRANLLVPFFFGGDGATFILPPSILDAAMRALLIHQQHTQHNNNFSLRVGNLQVAEIYQNGQELKISKFRTSSVFSIPVLLGNGLAFAEKIIKGEDYIFSNSLTTEDALDLTGMQCRWDRIKPPENNYEVVSLLVIAKEMTDQSLVFKKVIECLDEIYGAPQIRRPISVSKLKIKTTLAKVRMEMRTRFGAFNMYYLLKTWGQGLILGSFYFRTKKGKLYLDQLVQLSDTLIIDGRINTVIAGTSQQRELLEAALNEMETGGEIIYGLYVSKESIMSCYVRNLNDNHVHFVDGSEGGYTKAAGILKNKLRSI
ncbi:MAG: DUF3095 domain-containing protein [Ferruginibacter sp.]